MSTVLELVELKIRNTTESPVFLRSDFNELGSYRQIGRALRTLLEQGALLRVGYGVYIKARKNRFTNEPMPDIEGGTDAVLLEVLDRLQVNYEFYGLTEDYLRGDTPQIPAQIQVKISKKFKRRLSMGSCKLTK